MDVATPSFERLRAAGLRPTPPRAAVLAVLDAARDHPRIDQIVERVRAGGTTLSTQGAYDVCDVLHAAGLARRIAIAGAPVRFEGRVGDNHHHLVCRACGATHDVPCAVGAAPCLHPTDLAGFALEEAEVTYWGTCPVCRTSPSTSTAPAPPTERTPA